MLKPSMNEKSEQLRALHLTGHPLILVNAWDAVSARIIEELGFPAIATTSAGVAWVEGYADGQRISRDHMLARVERIARAVRVPVTADLEGGYGSTVQNAMQTASGAIRAGAVGLNFEDGQAQGDALIDMDRQVERIGAMRSVAGEHGVNLVINARTDVFLANVGSSDAWRLEEAIRRGNHYLKAGADCIFVPGVSDEATIAALVSAIPGPLNILASARAPSIDRLRALGVARVSVGSGAIGYALAKFRAAAILLRDGGNFDFLGERMSHADLDALFPSE